VLFGYAYGDLLVHFIHGYAHEKKVAHMMMNISDALNELVYRYRGAGLRTKEGFMSGTGVAE
jgi:hypothetical protein